MSYSGYSSNYSSSKSNDIQGAIMKTTNPKENPLDTVSNIIWNPYEKDMFLVSSWDGFVRAYSIIGTYTPQFKQCWKCFFQHPVISCSISQDGIIFAGLADGSIMASDIRQPNKKGLLGSHDAPICKLFWLQKFNLLLSFGFDSTMKFWSVQTINGTNLQKQFGLPSKTYTADVDFPYLLIGSAESRIAIINLQKLPNLQIPNQYLKVSVQIFSKFTACRIFAPRKRVMLGCADGRMAFIQFKDYTNIAFQQPLISKSNKKEGSSSTYGQINSVDIGMHDNQVFAIITGTQQIAFFNLNAKDKAKKISGKTTCVRLSPDGKYVVYAQGNDWNNGIDDLQKSKVPKLLGIKFTPQDLSDMTRRK